jgi:hypothetical protein
MTLSVDAFRRDKNGEIVWLPLPSDLAGTDQTRYGFYGGEKAVNAGLVLLPTLRDSSPLMVSGMDLKILKQEVMILHSLLGSDEAEYWNFRLNNILAAIKEAEKYGAFGGVSIG